jgi:hypothetical protein
MRDLATAEKNIVDALAAFDSKYEETVLKRPVSLEKLLEVAGKTLELGGTPTFIRKGRAIHVSDQSTFDYSVLGESITSFSIGLDQLLVGFDLENLGHDAFETFAWYSSAFQFMDSIMSIHGIHFVHKPFAPTLAKMTQKKVLGQRQRKELLQISRKYFEIPFLRAETNGSGWEYKRAAPSHEARWDDFGKLLIALIDSKKSREIPDEVRSMYGYLKAIADFKAHRLDWTYFSVKLRNEGQFKSAILRHGKDIADMRHRAVYQNQTYDLFSYAMLEQGRKVDEFTNVSRKFVKRFALAMARWNAEILGDIWTHLKSMKPSPRRGIDWAEVACRYAALRIALTEIRLEKIHANREIAGIHSAIPELTIDLLASLKMRKTWPFEKRPVRLA